MSTPTTKPWYKSKLVLLGLAAVFVFGGGLLYNLLNTQGITQTQIDVLSQQYPDIKAGVEQIQTGQNVFQGIGLIFGALVAIVRAWFTSKSIR